VWHKHHLGIRVCFAKQLQQFGYAHDSPRPWLRNGQQCHGLDVNLLGNAASIFWGARLGEKHVSARGPPEKGLDECALACRQREYLQ
jgi:hypothetical protein